MPEFEDDNTSVPDPNAFNPDESDADSRLERRRVFAETLTQHGYPDTLVLSRDRAGAVFHDRRLAIVEYLADHEPSSVRALATELGYDKGVVSRDLRTLAGIDVIEYVDNGRAKAPRLKHAHVAVEPIV